MDLLIFKRGLPTGGSTSSYYGNMGDGDYNTNGVPRPGFLGRIYWIVIGSFLIVLFLANISASFVKWNRIRIQKTNKSQNSELKPRDPARSSTIIAKIYNAWTQTIRELSNYYIPQIHLFPNSKLFKFTISFKRSGDLIITISYYLILLILFFSKLNPNKSVNYETFYFRAAWIAISQLPLLVALSTRQSILAYLTGSSPERLNYFHKMVARAFFVTASLHFGFAMRNWNLTNYASTEIKTNTQIKRGLGAYSILCWIIFSSFFPFRKMCYEFFVIQHIISLCCFIVMLCLHCPNYTYKILMPVVAIYLFDRCARLVCVLLINKGIFRFNKADKLTTRYHASVSTNLNSSCSRFSIVKIKPNKRSVLEDESNKFILSWSPGQYIFINFPTLSPHESHPFTIGSLPSDNEIILTIRERKGFTKKLYKYAENNQSLDGSTQYLPVVIEGPYGRHRDFKQFDTSILLGAGSGMSFIFPIAVDIVRSALEDPIKVVTRQLKIILVVQFLKDLKHYDNYIDELLKSRREVYLKTGKKLVVTVHIYTTCESFEQKYDIEMDVIKENKAEVKTNVVDAASRSGSESESFIGVKEQDISEINDTNTCGNDEICGCKKQPCCCVSNDIDVFPITTTSTTTEKHEISDSAHIEDQIEDKNKQKSPSTNITAQQKKSGKIIYKTGRPKSIRRLILPLIEKSRGETGIASCGPTSFNQRISNEAIKISDERGANKGTGAQGIYIHCETFGW